MMPQQLDLVDFIAGMPCSTAPIPPTDPRDLLPHRPAAWERSVGHFRAHEIRIEVSLLWTHVVVEQLREGSRGDMLLRDGRIDRRDMMWPPRMWAEPCRLILMSAADAADIHAQWCLELSHRESKTATFRFADRPDADRKHTSQLLRALEEKQS
ncbi:hypothetical protein MSKU15_1249 [Komagataeibacter diospyri]|uniref:hypothetical protein n=1 Tax=Komagataeibacter diospyri TaxID=1932662 RepID=UPI001134103C|nr:hypothetical protein [Komagataeibacter diospyri]GCE89648.1 hypothetical protein MSKU15_1249 [Komagataeibacter diospyri]